MRGGKSMHLSYIRVVVGARLKEGSYKAGSRKSCYEIKQYMIMEKYYDMFDME